MNMNEKTVNIKTLSAASSGTISLGGELTVHRLGFGAMRITGDGIWGPPKDPAAAIAVLRRAVELGVNFIDTADSYGPNVSEELIAEALAPYPKGRHQVSEIRRCQALTQDKCQPALKAGWPLRRPEPDRSAHNPQEMLGSKSLAGSRLRFHSGIAPLPEYGKCAGRIRRRRKHDCGESGRRASCKTVADGHAG